MNGIYTDEWFRIKLVAIGWDKNIYLLCRLCRAWPTLIGGHFWLWLTSVRSCVDSVYCFWTWLAHVSTLSLLIDPFWFSLYPPLISINGTFTDKKFRIKLVKMSWDKINIIKIEDSLIKWWIMRDNSKKSEGLDMWWSNHYDIDFTVFLDCI